MKKLLSMLLLICSIFCFVACDEDFESDRELEYTGSNIEASDNDLSSKDMWEFSQSKDDMTYEKAEKTAKELVGKYKQIKFLGVCCDGEYSYDDMSCFLTDEQKADYNYAQYKIKCCDSVRAAKKHALKYLHNSYLDDFDESNFFYDDEENLYVLFLPVGFEEDDHTVFSIEEFSNDSIVACETVEIENGETITTYEIVKTEDDFIIQEIIKKIITKRTEIVDISKDE